MHHMPPHEIFSHKKAPFKGPEAVEKVAKRHFFEFFSSGACAYGAVSTECKVRKPLGFHPF